MSEQGMRQRIIQALRPLDAVSVENSVYPGTPDVNFVEGWAELKWLRSWPERAGTIVSIDHFTAQQRVWLERRARRRGRAILLLQVGHEWLGFDGRVAAEVVGRVEKAKLITVAQRYWPDGLNEKELIQWCERSS